MDYEKKYRKAFANARQEYNTTENVEIKQWLEELFPDLKENKMEWIEKIRQELKSYLARREVKQISESDACLQWIAWLENQGKNQPTIVWHSASEEPEEMKELFCEWESDDATWHDVAFYDEESHTFRHDKMPINVTKWAYVDELLKKQVEQKPIDKVEPRFKVKYAGSEYNVFEVKDIAGVSFYGIEDEHNHIDYVRAANCERVDCYNIKENGSPFPIKPAKFSKESPACSEED